MNIRCGIIILRRMDMDIDMIYQYVDIFYNTLNMEPLMGDILNIEILTDEEFRQRVSQFIPEGGQEENPVTWYLVKKQATMIIKDDLFIEGTDDRYGLECLFTCAAEIYYHFSGFWDTFTQYTRNIFYKYIETGIMAYREFFCAYLANAGISILFAEMGRDDYSPEKRKKMSKHILKKTLLSSNSADQKMSTILYGLSKLASTEDKEDSVSDLSSVSENKQITEALNALYRTILLHLADNFDGKYLNEIGKRYHKMRNLLNGS